MAATAMANLIVRHIDESLVQALKQRAARHGRSAAAEHREIIASVTPPAQAQVAHRHCRSLSALGSCSITGAADRHSLKTLGPRDVDRNPRIRNPRIGQV